MDDSPQTLWLTEQQSPVISGCTSGCVRINVVCISPTGLRNPGDDACLQKCRETYLKE